MKILYHHRIASKDGQYVHVEEIINALKEQGHKVVLVAPDVAENSDFGSDGGWVDTLKSKLPKFMYELLEFGYSFWAFLKLSIAIVKHKPDFIYERYNLFFPAGIWVKKLFGKKLLLEVNAPILEERSKYNGIGLSRLAKWTQDYCWRNADVVLPVTNVLADYIRAVGVPENKISIIPNGINKSNFLRPVDPPNQLPDLSDKLVIGFVGFAREWHGLDRVLNIIHELKDPNLFFLIVGDGPAIPKLKEQAKSLGISNQIYISGIVQRTEMPNWLQPFSIALQPDVVAYASPLKMLEYMALGKAIVAPKTANIEELLTEQHDSLLFDPENENSFSEKLTLLIKDKELCERLGKKAALTIDEKQLTWLMNAEKITNKAKELIGK